MGHARLLARRPAFALSVIGCIAIAIALTATMVAILDTVMHPIIAFPNADRLTHVFARGDGANKAARPADRIDALRAATFIEAMALTTSDYEVVETGQYIDRHHVARVSPNFFAITGFRATDGRVFTASDEVNAAVISESLRRKAFPANASVLGKVIRAGELDFEIIGVVPNTIGVTPSADVWLALPPDALEPGSSIKRVIPLVLFRHGSVPERVSMELKAIAGELERRYGTGRVPFVFAQVPVKQDPAGFLLFHAVLAGAGLIVLIVAGVNVANLLLARALDRRPEHALRLALGAPASALARNAIGESALLAIIGGAAGLFLGIWCIDIAIANAPRDLPWLGTLAPKMSWRVYAYALFASLRSRPSRRSPRCCGSSEPIRARC